MWLFSPPHPSIPSPLPNPHSGQSSCLAPLDLMGLMEGQRIWASIPSAPGRGVGILLCVSPHNAIPQSSLRWEHPHRGTRSSPSLGSERRGGGTASSAHAAAAATGSHTWAFARGIQEASPKPETSQNQGCAEAFVWVPALCQQPDEPFPASRRAWGASCHPSPPG